MTTNQGAILAAVQAQTGTDLGWNGDWMTLFDQQSIPDGAFDERMLAWINEYLGSSHYSLPAAQQAFAENAGFYNWGSMDALFPSWLSPEIIARGGRGLAWQFMQADNLNAPAQYWNVNRLGSQAEMLADVRNGDALDYDADGTLRSYGVNVPAIPLGVGLVPRGQRTNKNTNYNANPTNTTNMVLEGASGGAPDPGVTLSVVDDAAKLATSKLSLVASSGKVFRLNNPPGGSAQRAVISGNAGNVNSHGLSCYMRGSGTAQLRFQGGASVSVNLTADYQRVTVVGTPNSASFPMYVLAQPGAEVFFTLNQLEEGSRVTPPIVTEGSAATRLADSITAPNFADQAAALGLGDGVEFELSTTVERLGASSTRHVFALGSGSGDLIDLYLNTSNVLTLRRAKSGQPTADRTKTLTNTGIFEIAGRVTPDEVTMTVNGEDLGAVSYNYGLPAFDGLNIGQNISGGNALNGPLRELQMWRP